MGTLAWIAIWRNPVCHEVVRLRVPSGVIANVSFCDLLNLSIIISVRDLELFFFLGTGIPPMLLKKTPIGQKNHVSFMRKPALRPNEAYASLPRIKSQLLVCGATQIIHFG